MKQNLELILTLKSLKLGYNNKPRHSRNLLTLKLLNNLKHMNMKLSLIDQIQIKNLIEFINTLIFQSFINTSIHPSYTPSQPTESY